MRGRRSLGQGRVRGRMALRGMQWRWPGSVPSFQGAYRLLGEDEPVMKEGLEDVRLACSTISISSLLCTYEFIVKELLVASDRLKLT